MLIMLTQHFGYSVAINVQHVSNISAARSRPQ